MRIPGWFLAFLGFAALIASTLFCTVTAFAFTRDSVISLWESGQRIESPLEVADALFQAVRGVDDAPLLTVTAAPTEVVIALLSPTPFPTTAPQTTSATATSPWLVPDDPVAQPSATPTVSITATPAPPTPTPDPLAQYERDDPRSVNILLMGIDERVGFTQERAYRTDTMMVVHVDPVRKTAGVLSFPRDLWVEIPNYQPNRINNANYIGDINAYPGGGGPALASETIQANFGVRIDHYVMINFTVFETVVDLLAPNGVEICVTEVIRDPDYPDAGFGTINVEFDPGCQNLNGERLLQYARTRATQGGDLDRARRQQEVVEALRAHVLSAVGIRTFISQIPPLFNELVGSYRTDLQLDEILGLALLVNEIPQQNIRYNVIGPGYVDPQTNVNGDQILVPIRSEIQELVQETFEPQVNITLADLRTRALTENATIRIYNGSNVQGLAGLTREYLLTIDGVQISEVGNMPAVTNQPTEIRNYGGARSTAQWLAELLGLPSDRIRVGNDGLVIDGIVIVVGPDIQNRLAGQ